MGQVDFGEIISAAAVSTLGVLSLIIVALGVIAFFFFKGSPEKIKLSVWWTMVLAGGLFAAAVVKQSEPNDRQDPTPEPTQTPVPVDTPTPVATNIPSPAPTPSIVPTATPTPDVKPSPLASASPAAAGSSDLSGQWRDNDGYNYVIAVYGSAVGIQQWLNGMAAGYGQGTISGRNLRYGFVTADGNQGNCAAVAAADGRSISGSCTSGGASWPFSVER